MTELEALRGVVQAAGELASIGGRLLDGEIDESRLDETRYALLRLMVVDLSRKNATEAATALIAQLRKNPETNTWRDIGASVDLVSSAVQQRFGISETSSPEARRARAAQTKPRVHPASLPGMSVTEAEKASGIARSTIYVLAKKDPSAKWFEKVPTKGKSEATTRIVDVDGLLTAHSNGQPGISVGTAAQQTGLSTKQIEAAIAATPDAKWVLQTTRVNSNLPSLRILDAEAMRVAVESESHKSGAVL